MMSSYNPSPQPQPSPTSSDNNRKLWIIGGVLAIILLFMGGCVVCVSLVAYSMLNEDERKEAPNRENRASSNDEGDARKAGAASQLAGNSWTGSLNCDDGDTMPVVIKVSDEGQPVYSYTTSRGDREAPITEVGQTFRFVPPGGGVFTAVVDSLSVSAERFNYSTRTTTERSGGGTISQGGGRVSVSASLSGENLDVEIARSSQLTTSQPGIVLQGDETTYVCRGTIPKQ